MRILLAHNFYQQPGGADALFYAEAALLEQHGHAPLRYVMHYDQIDRMTRISARRRPTISPNEAAGPMI